MDLVIVANAVMDSKRGKEYYGALDYWRTRIESVREYRDVYCFISPARRLKWLRGYYLFGKKRGLYNCNFEEWLWYKSGGKCSISNLNPNLAGRVINQIRACDGDVAYHDFSDYETKLQDTRDALRLLHSFFGGEEYEALNCIEEESNISQERNYPF